MDSEKLGINMGLKNMSDFRELCFKKIIRIVICCLEVHSYLTIFFRKKNCSYNNSTVKWKSWKHQDGLCFSGFMDPNKQNLLFYSSNVACQQYWSSEKICLELKVLMSKFLDIRSSRPKVSCKKGVLKNFAKLIEKYPWCSL